MALLTVHSDTDTAMATTVFAVVNPFLFFFFGAAAHVHPRFTTTYASAHSCLVYATSCFLDIAGDFTAICYASCFTMGACAFCDISGLTIRRSFNMVCWRTKQRMRFDCVVCFEPFEASYAPVCGHACMCATCARDIGRCPVCREPVANGTLRRIYTPM